MTAIILHIFFILGDIITNLQHLSFGSDLFFKNCFFLFFQIVNREAVSQQESINSYFTELKKTLGSHYYKS